jgi:prepilin-type N-terminal cleavage/methylation domain-containing protein
MKKSSRGFSLIELLIVVAIILIIAAIAIPNLLRSRIAANQASAVGSLRTLNTAEVTYSVTYNTGFSPTLGDLGPPANSSPIPTASFAGLVDEVLSGIGSAGGTAKTANQSTKSGYQFTYAPQPPITAAGLTRTASSPLQSTSGRQEPTSTIRTSPASSGKTAQKWPGRATRL